MKEPENPVLVAHRAVFQCVNQLSDPTEKLAVLATVAGEVIASNPRRNERRALLKSYDEAVRGSVKDIVQTLGAMGVGDK